MYQDFSSLPPEQEREFIVFEQRTRESAKSALTIGTVVAAIYGLLTVVIVMSHDKPKPLIEADDIGASSILSDVDEPRERTAPAPAAVPVEQPPVDTAPAADEASADEASADEASADEASADEASAEPPPPPPGATKAPPTAVVGE